MNRHLLVMRAAACAVASILGSEPASAQQATAFQIDAAHSGATAMQIPLVYPLTQLWQVDLGGTVSYPLIANGLVYVLAAGPHNEGTRLFALDERSGRQAWLRTINPTHAWRGLTFGDDRVYAIATDGHLSAFDAATGTTAWSRVLPRQTSFEGSPVFSQGIVYVGGSGIGGTLYAVDAASGRLDWTQTFESAIGQPPTVSNSAVYLDFGCGGTYAMAPASGVTLWTRAKSCDGGGNETAALSGGVGLMTIDPIDGNLILDAATGQTRGTYDATLIPTTKGTVTYAVYQGRLVATHQATGVKLWQFGHRLTSAPIVVDGAVFVGDKEGMVFARDAATGAPLWQASVGATVAAPPYGLAAGEGVVVVPAKTTVTAFGN